MIPVDHSSYDYNQLIRNHILTLNNPYGFDMPLNKPNK